MAKKIMMPFTQAGILGFSSDEVAGGLLLSPEQIVITAGAVILFIKLVDIAIALGFHF